MHSSPKSKPGSVAAPAGFLGRLGKLHLAGTLALALVLALGVPGLIQGPEAQAAAPLVIWGGIALMTAIGSWISDTVSGLVTDGVVALIHLLSGAVQVFLSLIAGLADGLLAISFDVPREIYDAVWIPLRDFTNVVFVGALIVGAVMIMLSLDTGKWSMKNLMTPLILAVIGVNLSWMAGLVMLDVARLGMEVTRDITRFSPEMIVPMSKEGWTGMTTGDLVEYKQQGGGCVSESGDQRGGKSVDDPEDAGFYCLKFDPYEVGIFTSLVMHTQFFEYSLANKADNQILSAFVVMVFLIMLIIPLVKVCFVLFARLVMMILMFGTMPLSFAALAIPDLRQYFRQFWTAFIGMIFAPVVIAFFMTLALLVIPVLSGNFTMSDQAFRGDGEFIASLLRGNLFATIVSIFGLITFLGLASKYGMNYSWASTAVSLGEKVGRKLRGGTYLAMGATMGATAALGGRALSGVARSQFGQQVAANLQQARTQLGQSALGQQARSAAAGAMMNLQLARQSQLGQAAEGAARWGGNVALNAGEGAWSGARLVRAVPMAGKSIQDAVVGNLRGRDRMAAMNVANRVADAATAGMRDNPNAWHARVREALGIDLSISQNLRDEILRPIYKEIGEEIQRIQPSNREALERIRSLQTGDTDRERIDKEMHLRRLRTQIDRMNTQEIAEFRQILNGVEAGAIPVIQSFRDGIRGFITDVDAQIQAAQARQGRPQGNP